MVLRLLALMVCSCRTVVRTSSKLMAGLKLSFTTACGDVSVLWVIVERGGIRVPEDFLLLLSAQLEIGMGEGRMGLW